MAWSDPGKPREKFKNKIQREIISIDLMTRNFHEFVDIKPLFLYVLMEIAGEIKTVKAMAAAASSTEGKRNEAKARGIDRSSSETDQNMYGDHLEELFALIKNLKGIAKRVIVKQREILEEFGDLETIRIPMADLCVDRHIRNLKPWHLCGNKGFNYKGPVQLKLPFFIRKW